MQLHCIASTMFTPMYNVLVHDALHCIRDASTMFTPPITGMRRRPLFPPGHLPWPPPTTLRHCRKAQFFISHFYATVNHPKKSKENIELYMSSATIVQKLKSYFNTQPNPHHKKSSGLHFAFPLKLSNNN